MIDSINVNGTLYQLIPRLENYVIDTSSVIKRLEDTTNHGVYDGSKHVFNVQLKTTISTELQLRTISGILNNWEVVADFSQYPFTITMDFFSDSYRVHDVTYDYVLYINDSQIITTPAGAINIGIDSYLIFRLHSVATSTYAHDWNCYYSLIWTGVNDKIHFMGVDNPPEYLVTEQLLWNIGQEGGTGNFPKTKIIAVHDVYDKKFTGQGLPGGGGITP